MFQLYAIFRFGASDVFRLHQLQPAVFQQSTARESQHCAVISKENRPSDCSNSSNEGKSCPCDAAPYRQQTHHKTLNYTAICVTISLLRPIFVTVSFTLWIAILKTYTYYEGIHLPQFAWLVRHVGSYAD